MLLLFLLFVTFSLYSTNAGQLFDADLCCPVQDIRASALTTGLMSLNHASKFFDNEEELISYMQSCTQYWAFGPGQITAFKAMQ